MATYVQLTRAEFEGWLDDIGFQGKWRIKPGRGGVYQLILSPNVGIEINSTTGSADEVMGVGAASMNLKLVSRITGQVLNKKAMGQSHFKRTINWRKTWAEGIDRMRDAFVKSQSFYDAIAEIEDRQEYQEEMLAKIEAVPGWDNNPFLQDLHKKVEGGGILTQKQKDAIDRQPKPRPAPAPVPERDVEQESQDQEMREVEETPEEDPRVERLRDLWVAAKRGGDNWTMDFAKSLADTLRRGRPLSPKQEQILNDKNRIYRVACVSRIAERYLQSPLSLQPDYGTSDAALPRGEDKRASTGAECYFWLATDKQWYMAHEDMAARPFEDEDEDEDSDWRDSYDPEYEYFGPFPSFEAAKKYLDQNFANPGGYSVDKSGRQKPPTKPLKPTPSPYRRWA